MSVRNEWVEKAEEDYLGCLALQRRRRVPLPGLVCFHAQQCAEKYLKALLWTHGYTVPRIHDLPELLRQCEQVDSALASLRTAAGFLNAFSVAARYPGLSTGASDAQDAVRHMREIRRVLRQQLGL
jgi:HEPN domain-containing protein